MKQFLMDFLLAMKEMLLFAPNKTIYPRSFEICLGVGSWICIAIIIVAIINKTT